MRNWLPIVGCLALLGGSCGSSKKTTPMDAGADMTPVASTTVKDYEPVGTLTGAVADAFDNLPLPGAKLTINYGGVANTVTTDATGTFSFANIPASAAASAGGYATATGTYVVVLDMTGVSVPNRTYQPFRNLTVSVQFTQLGETTTLGTQTTNNDTTGVDHLVSNVNFYAHQTRAKIAGTVYIEPALTPGQADLLLKYTAGTNGYAPVGSIVGYVTSGTDGTFAFSGIEEGLSYTIVLANANWVLNTSGNNYASTAIYAAEGGATTTVASVVVNPHPGSDTQPPYIASSVPIDGSLLPVANKSSDIVLNFNEAMVTTHTPSDMIASFKRVGRRCPTCTWQTADDTNPLLVPFTATWDAATSTILTIKHSDLEGGYRYRLTVNNASLTDLAGNARTGTIPDTFPAELDALAQSTGTNDLYFEVDSGAASITVSGLAQEADTADNQTTPTTVRAYYLDAMDPNNQTFATNSALGFYSATASNYIYISWSPPGATVGFNVYVASDANSAPIPLTAAPLDPSRLPTARPSPPSRAN